MALVVLKPGHVRPVHAGHPWVYQQAIGRIEGDPGRGDEVRVVDPGGKFLGRGLYSPKSAIPVRLFTSDDVPVDAVLFRRRLERALELRRSLNLPSSDTNAFRLVHGEGDGLPGLIVDVFDDVAIVQLNTYGVKMREGVVFDFLMDALAIRTIMDRTSPQAERIEGVPQGTGAVRGPARDELQFKERGLAFSIPTALEQKTGFYLDQRNLRARVEALSAGKDVLDVYSFVGAFSLAALRGGASRVRAIDQNAMALETASILARTHGFSSRFEADKRDAVEAMEAVARQGGADLVLCDPPKLAPSKSKVEQALVAYRRVARAACRATKPSGLLFFSSCSHAIGAPELVRAVALSAREVNLSATLLESHIQAADHPVPAAFPEGLYLKSMVFRITLREGA